MDIFFVIAEQCAVKIPQKMLNVLGIQFLGHLPAISGVVPSCVLHDHLRRGTELQCLRWVEPAGDAIKPAFIERSTPRVDFD